MNAPDILAEAAERGGAGADLIVAYYAGIAAEDLAGRDPQAVLDTVVAHRDLAGERRPGTAAVRVHGSGPYVLEVVTDDMPFLLDSLTAEVVRRGGAVRLVVHPQLRVRRDQGRLLQVLGRRAEHPDEVDGTVTESWIHLEVEGGGDPDDLVAGVRRVLDDVRLAVGDWDAMRAVAVDVADRVADLARGGPAGSKAAEQAAGAAEVTEAAEVAKAAGAAEVAGAAGAAEVTEAAEVAELLRWLAEDHFTFLGLHEVRWADGRAVPVAGSGLGLLQGQRAGSAVAHDLLARPRAHPPLTLGKAGVRSPVHKPAYLDVVTVRTPDGQGEHRFVGLFASSAYTEAARRIPVVRRKVEAALQRSGYGPTSYDGRDVLAILETFPRDELFQTGVEDLTRIATAVLRLRERRQLRLFLRRDETGRSMSALVYLPRDRYTTRVRVALADALREAFGATSADYTARVTESVLARLHFVVRVDPPAVLPDVDVPALEARLAGLARSWTDELAEAAQAALGPEESARLLATYGEAFPEAYKEDFPASTGLVDLQRLAALMPGGPLATSTGPGEAPDRLRLKLYRTAPLSLSEVLPVLQALGVDVLDERPYELECADGCSRWVYDFGLRYRAGSTPPGSPSPAADPLLEQALDAAWQGLAESDGLSALVTRARLPWRSVGVLRAYTSYLRQAYPTASAPYVHDVLVANAHIATLLVRLFEALLDPAQLDPAQHDPALRDPARQDPVRPGAAQELAGQVTAELDGVASLDADRILRALLSLVLATVRTNYWQDRPHLSLKLDPRQVPVLPQPRPAHEIWVYSPRFEGVHLRFGAVARGGLRWSDRREDFRTEVLGLVKAQMVKNAVIVPTGAKGGFVGKRLPDPAVDRAAWLAEGLECYRGFVRGLLDVTDDLVDGVVEPPPQVVRRDGDDPYLVVAADKGTATFSDTANAVAAEYGFWLGDAFASGGSAGYDHKAMGITARGAWESVARHFRELGVDIARDPVTVVGIGDMSGDVFGNGMLLSPHLRLVAAFDHRHVFLDPDPDPAVSFAERQRLAALPRSSWADYDPARLSPGGLVVPRAAKTVPLSPEVRARLQVTAEALTPDELVRAVLTAPVDLLWNGGIGTYVKGSGETHAQVGDRANDAVRIDGTQLRARVVGEGGNLGLTQPGRVEVALAGGRLNTDAIDNSAGVDTSDHEVNYKVLLRGVPRGQRDTLLAGLTDEVARLVLCDNAEQNLALGLARVQAPAMRPVHARFLAQLEARGVLDRALEQLPSDAVLEQRGAAGLGLTSPELSVLLAYAKIALRAELLDSPLPEQVWSGRALREYFPAELLAVASPDAHPLRREIVTTTLVNDVVDRAGITFVFRAAEETGATASDTVRAYAVAREVFALPDLWQAVGQLDGAVPTAVQAGVLLEGRRLLDRTVRWLLQERRSQLDVTAEVERLGPALASLIPRIPTLLVGVEAERLQRRTQELASAGVPPELAQRTAGLLYAFCLLDVVQVAGVVGHPAEQVAATYFALSDRYEIERLLRAIAGLPRPDRWQALARSALRYDLYAALAGLTRDVLSGSASGTPAAEAIARWEHAHAEGLTRARSTLREVLAVERPDLATTSVALRTVRTLLPG